MKNKGFVLMETIVVIVVISVALVTIFSSYNKILRKVKEENKYDTSEYVYMTKYIKEYLKQPAPICTGVNVNNISPISGSININEYYGGNACHIKNNNAGKFPIKKIYILTNLNKFNIEVSGVNNSLHFDAYMIDYIRQMDVTNNDEYLIVEYERIAVDRYGNEIIPTNCPDSKKVSGECLPLTETYIASLEW